MRKLSETSMRICIGIALCLSSLPHRCVAFSVNRPKHVEDSVSVHITRQIPNTQPIDVYNAFLDFTWRKGGGLPVVCKVNEKTPSKRSLFLLGDEVLVERTDNENIGKKDKIVQEYRLEELGPIWKSEIVPGSHTGSVSFSPVAEDASNGFSGTEISWKVSYKTQNRQKLWQSVTESSITDACDNLAAFVSEPLLMTKQISIDTDLSPKALSEQWFEFVWRGGGGLPIPLPPFGLTKNFYDRVLIPPFLRERILEIKDSPSHTDILYTVVNPSLLTYPVHKHLGNVKFKSSDSGEDSSLEMLWEVSIVPINGCEKFVTIFTETIISALARNFKRHIEDAGDASTVKVFLPRGIKKDEGPLFEVRKDTWVGSVLYSHQKDVRGVLDQAKDLWTPWRWGADDKIDGSLSWDVGEIAQDKF